MQALAPVTVTHSPGYVPFNDSPDDSRQGRTRRDTTGSGGAVAIAPPVVVLDKDVPKHFIDNFSKAKAGVDYDDFIKGYKTPSAVVLPGYVKNMSSIALMRLGVDQKLSPEQMGALKYFVEKRLVPSAMDYVRQFTKIVSEKGVTVTPMPQSFYLNVINQMSDGQCAGISHLLSLAVTEGKQQVFIDNITQALSNPDAPESINFFRTLADVQNVAGDPFVAHDSKTMKFAPYTDIASDLISSPTTKTLLISAEKHRITAGVIVDADKKRSYYYFDPNIGYTVVHSREQFESTLKRVFTHPDIAHLIEPKVNEQGARLYQVSVFNPDYASAISGESSKIRHMYNAPIWGLDALKVIDVSGVPTADNLRALSGAPSAPEVTDYNRVLYAAGKLHEAKGVSQFHKAVDTLKVVKQFINDHPGSALLSGVRSLEQPLLAAINDARVPLGYPDVFERMEQQRAYLAEDKLGADRRDYGKPLHGTDFYIHHPAATGRAQLNGMTDALNEALLKLQQTDPKTARAVGTDINVIVAKPGDQPHTQLSFGRTPTLIMGDDFFTPPAASGGAVADRIGREAQHSGGNPLAAKQAAILAGKFGMLGYYKADPVGFLELVNNKEPFRDGHHDLGSRATRSGLDFMEEAYTARLYDGKLDSHTSAALGRLFAPAADSSLPSVKPVPQSVAVAPTSRATAPISDVEVRRLKALDDADGPLKIGQVSVGRVELYKIGVRSLGEPIEKQLRTDPRGHITTGVEIDYDRLMAYMKSKSPDVGARVTTVISELSVLSGPASPLLVSRGDGRPVPEAFQKHISDTAKQAAALSDLERSGKPRPADLFSPPTPGKPAGATNAGGLGFQAFSTFQGLRASIDALSRGDTTAGAIGLGAVASDYVGMGTEAALNHLAKKMMSETASPILNFKASSVGKLVGKASGTAGAVISVPFDIYNAVDSFNKGKNSKGKESQDHYVNAGFSVASAATSIGLTAAFLAGAGSAGPAGLVVAGVLMAAQAIYNAVREVENIDKYTPLTGGQKFTLGFGSFLGIQTPFKFIKPYLEGKLKGEHEERKREFHAAFLQGAGKDRFERVVFGALNVEVGEKPAKVPAPWFAHFIPGVGLAEGINGGVPGYEPTIDVQGANDHLRAPSGSWAGKRNTVEGEPGPGKGTLWDMGDGDDSVAGVRTKPNYFLLGAGKKLISGGEADDTVIFNADARQTLHKLGFAQKAELEGSDRMLSEIWGGGGRNTLVFNGELSTSFPEGGLIKTYKYSGHAIDFKTRTISVNTHDSKTEGVTPVANFHDFSNVSTVENGESYIVGDEADNQFVLNGKKDVVLTGKGMNVIVIKGGASVIGEEGSSNIYVINKGDKEVTIKDPNDSAIKLDYSAAQISGWSVSPSGDLTVNLKGG